MKILVVHGPNLTLLGKRDPAKYGVKTLVEINNLIQTHAAASQCEVVIFQSNHEGSIIDFLQEESSRDCDGVLINPGALTRYGFSLRQALIDLGKPVVEVHMSDIHKTGIATHINILDDVRVSQITGLQEQSYVVGLTTLLQHI